MNIVEAFVPISLDMRPLDKAIPEVGKRLKALNEPFAMLQSMATKAFLGLTAAAGFLAKAYGDAEAEEQKLRSAVQASYEMTHKQEMAVSALNDEMAKYSKFATDIQLLTIYDDDDIKGLMGIALNLGVARENLEGISKIGIGVGAKFFGGDAKAGIEAVSLAYNGQFKSLQKLIPGLKQATTTQDKWNLVLKAGESGFKIAEQQAQTFNGALKQLWGQVGNVAENLGSALVPQLQSVGKWMTAAAVALQKMTPEQNAQIVKWGEVALAVAGVIAFGPKIVSFASTVVGGLVNVGKALVSVGRLMITGLFTPIGIVIGGFALLTAGFAYLIGSGNDWVSKTLNGFSLIVSGLDKMLGSWEGFKATVSMIGSQAWYALLEGFYNVRNYLQDGWSQMSEFIEQTFWHAFEGMYGAWDYLKTGAQKFMNWFSAGWSNMVDFIADKFTDWIVSSRQQDEDEQTRRVMKHAGKSDADINKQIDSNHQQTTDYADKARKERDAQKARDYKAKQDAIDKESAGNTSYVHDTVERERQKAKIEREKERAANDKDADATLASLEKARQQQLEDDKKKIAAMPKLSDKLKEQFDELIKKVGIADSINGIKSLQDDFKKLQDEALKNINGVKGPSTTPQNLDALSKSGGQSVKQSFEENLRRQMIGGALINQEEERKKQEEAAAKKAKAEEDRKTREEQKNNTNATKENTEAAKALTLAMQRKGTTTMTLGE